MAMAMAMAMVAPAAVALTPGVSTAASVAPPPAGSYTGTDAQNRGLTFFVSAARTSLQDVSVPLTDLRCLPDGGVVNDKIQVPSVALNPDGSFASTTTQTGFFAGHPARFTYIFRGNVHGVTPAGFPRLAGTLRESIAYTDTPARTCTTNDQAWTASRDTQPAQPTTPPPAGSYTGSDTQNRGLTFLVPAARTSLQDVSVPLTDLRCLPDGGVVNDKIQVPSVALNPDGSFASTTTQTGFFAGHPARFTYIFRGNVHGLSPTGLPRLAGTLRESISYTDTPARTCTTNDQSWTALRS